MSNERVEYIRELAIRQLESLQALGGDDIKGTPLELDLVMAVANLRQEIPQFEKSSKTSEISNKAVHSLAAAGVEAAAELDDDEDTFEDYEDEDEYEEIAPVVPEGFDDEETYQEFLDTQAGVIPTYTNEETGEIITPRPDDVVGNIGGQEVGNMDESLAKVDEYVAERNVIRDEETDEVLYYNEPENVPLIKIALSRNDGQELTVAQVLNNVLATRESETMLKTFGNNFDVLDGETSSVKIIRFFIDNDDDTARRASRGLVHGGGMMQFGGRVIVPNVGLVVAETIYE